MVTDIVQSLSGDVLDKQNATALLTGIVAETDRYSNEKATPHTMSIAGALMSAGASTQLVSNELDSVLKSQGLPPIAGGDEGNLEETEDGNTGELDIDHTAAGEEKGTEEKAADQPQEVDTQERITEKQSEEDVPKDSDEYLEHLNLSEDPHLDSTDSSDTQSQIDEPDVEESPPPADKTTNRLIKDPPHFTGQLTANTVPEDRQYTGSTDPLSNIPESKILGTDKQKQNEEIKRKAAARASSLQQKVDQTLREIEESVSSPHLAQEEDTQEETITPESEDARLSIEEAREAAETAAGDESRPESREDMGSAQLGNDIDHNDGSSTPPPPVPPPITPLS